MIPLITNGTHVRSSVGVPRKDACLSLDHALKRSLVTIVGGQGWGKTALMMGYLQERKLPAVWFTVEAGHVDNGDLLLKLLHRGISELSLKDKEPEKAYLFEKLALWPERLAIIIDCANAADPGEKLLALVMKLIHHSSKHVSFVMISRSRLRLPYMNLKLQNRLAELTEKELSFKPDEIAEYFRLSGFRLEERMIQRIYRETSGWALCLTYLQQIWSESKQLEMRKWHATLFDELFQYLFSEENDTQLAWLLDKFTRLSILHELKPDVVNAFLDADETEQLLELYGAGRLCLMRSGENTCQFIPAVKQFLYRSLQKRSGKAAVHDLHLKAAGIYESQYQYYYVFAQYLAAGRYEEAARVMQLMMNFYTPDRFLLLLDGSVEEICPSISISIFSMFLFRCIPVDVLLSCVPRVEAAIEQKKDLAKTATLANLQHRLGLIYFYMGDLQKSKYLFRESLTNSRQLDHPELVIINLSLLAQSCRFMGELEEGIGVAREALTQIEIHGTYDARMHTVWILTELLMEQGEFSLAEPIISELLKTAEQYDDEAARVYPVLVKAKFERLTGKPDEALKWAQQGLNIAEKFRIIPDRGWAYLELGFIYRSLNMLEPAILHISESERIFEHYAYFREMARKEKEAAGCIVSSETELQEGCKIEEVSELTSGLSLSVLGPLHIRQGGREVTPPRKSSVRLLLYLAANYTTKIPKDILLEELFPDADYVSQKNRFYVALSALRKSLEPGLASGRMSSYIVQIGELFYFDHRTCKLDLAEFETLVNDRDTKNPEERIGNLQRAEKLYKGDLLAEYPYESFLEPMRGSLKRSYLELLKELGNYYWGNREYKRGMDYFERRIEQDPYGETSYWEYLDLLLTDGFVQEARRIASTMKERLILELGLPIQAKLDSLFN